MDTTKKSEKAEVDERLVARRARLQPFCHVDPVKHHLRLQSYYQLARQLYRQSEVYYAQQAWDNAYVALRAVEGAAACMHCYGTMHFCNDV